MAAEQFTSQPGLDRSGQGDRRGVPDKLTNGDFDHVPEQAFFLIGGWTIWRRRPKSFMASRCDEAGQCEEPKWAVMSPCADHGRDTASCRPTNGLS